jgi:hypothetical protein
MKAIPVAKRFALNLATFLKFEIIDVDDRGNRIHGRRVQLQKITGMSRFNWKNF